MSERHRRYRHQFLNYGRNAADESRRHRVTRSVFFKTKRTHRYNLSVIGRNAADESRRHRVIEAIFQDHVSSRYVPIYVPNHVPVLFQIMY